MEKFYSLKTFKLAGGGMHPILSNSHIGLLYHYISYTLLSYVYYQTGRRVATQRRRGE